MNRILRILADTDQPMARYIWRACLIDLIPGLVILAAAMAFDAIAFGGPRAGSPSTASTDEPSLSWVLHMVVIAPWVETLLMWPVLSILKRVTQKTHQVAMVSGAIWGILHGLHSFRRGTTCAWGFFVFSLCFLHWEEKSKSKAIVVTSSVHMCSNTFVALLLIMLEIL